MNLSVVILAKDEEENIRDCIESVNFADEVIVIDDNSKDNTANIAKKLGARVYKRKLDGDFSSQRNFGLDKAKAKWVLFLDADERVGKELRDEIVQVIDNPLIRKEGFFIRRQDHMWGKRLKYGETGSLKLLRLARRKVGKWEREVHEKWEIMGRVGELNYPIKHYPHKDLSEFLSSINHFSTMHAKANRNEGKKASLLKIVFWPAGHFMKNYILKRGFLDKTEGFVVAMVMSFHSFLSWSKLWILQRDTAKN